MAGDGAGDRTGDRKGDNTADDRAGDMAGDSETGMTPEEAERAHLRGPAGKPDGGHRRMQELRKVGREYPFICPVDFKPHRGSPPGRDPREDPDFVGNHTQADGAHYLG
jgi:hypothetical protein